MNNSQIYLEGIKHCAWDCIGAGNIYSSLFTYDSTKIKESFAPMSDFCIIFHKKITNVGDACHFYLVQNASDSLLKKMYKKGFFVIQSGEQWTSPSGEKMTMFAFIAPDLDPIKGRDIFIAPSISIRYIGNEGNFNILNLGENGPIKNKLESFSLSHTSVGLERMLTDKLDFSKIDVACAIARYNNLKTHFLDYTFCSLIENIRRYYRSIGKGSFFDEKDSQKIINPEERMLNSIALLRDRYLAHNNHYVEDLIFPETNYEGYTTLDREKIYNALIQAAAECLIGEKSEDKLYEYLKKCSFPKIDYHSKEGSCAWLSITEYLTHGIYLRSNIEDHTKNRKAKERKRIIEKMGLSDKQMREIENSDRLRCIALHEHFPYSEYFNLGCNLNSHMVCQKRIANTLIHGFEFQRS